MSDARERLSLAFRLSAELGRKEDEVKFLRDELAKEKARTRKLGELVHTAADHLSRCKVTAGSQVRCLWPRIDKAALELVAALMLIDAKLPTEVEAIDLTEITSTLTIDGSHIA